ncbi:hypothetical protein [Rhodoblastus sp.]|uniref:hypothetical protein n=1 Tax=Rhodoblastus sp. TaxID=1962975 RepID=UPI0026007D1F|nr:hypothetical protein [Rhodoblastus sp.]
MNPARIAPVALCLVLTLGGCASPPPSGPSVSAVAEQQVSDRKFARDASDCRARARAATEQAAAVAGQFGLQGQYDSAYADCMLARGYAVSERGPRFADGPGVRVYGPGPYVYGPATVYSWGVGVGF